MKHESIKNQCWWHQSTTNARSHSNYCEQHQYQFAEHLQAIHKALTSNKLKINISALSININAKSIKSQCTEHQSEHQHAKHSVFISKAQSVSVPIHTASTANEDSTRLPYALFFQNEDFHFLQYASHSCHSARSRRRIRRIHLAN